MTKQELVKTPIKELRKRVYSLLKHYPMNYRVERLYEAEEARRSDYREPYVTQDSDQGTQC